MRLSWRWVVVGAATAVLVALPSAAHLLPVGTSTIGANTLLTRIRTSAGIGYSGYAESTGGLDLPVSTSDLTAASNLLGGRNQLRVWWRGAADWRVDNLALTGENDLYEDSTGIWTWSYESDLATRSGQDGSPVRVPRTDDLLPGNLARRLLSESAPTSVTRLSSERIAGRDAAGLRVTVADPRSTVRHIDVWALPADGLPLRVEVFGASSAPVVSSSMLDVDVSAPSRSVTDFVPAPGARVREARFGDLVSAIDNFGRARPPDTLVGLARRTDLALGAVGVYGRGVTEISAIPLPGGLVAQILPSLKRAAGVTDDSQGVAVAAGAVNLQVSAPSRFGNRWLLVGTVTPSTLKTALTQLPPPRGFGGRPRGRR